MEWSFYNQHDVRATGCALLDTLFTFTIPSGPNKDRVQEGMFCRWMKKWNPFPHMVDTSTHMRDCKKRLMEAGVWWVKEDPRQAVQVIEASEVVDLLYMEKGYLHITAGIPDFYWVHPFCQYF